MLVPDRICVDISVRGTIQTQKKPENLFCDQRHLLVLIQDHMLCSLRYRKSGSSLTQKVGFVCVNNERGTLFTQEPRLFLCVFCQQSI